jgi:hypothetical protein
MLRFGHFPVVLVAVIVGCVSLPLLAQSAGDEEIPLPLKVKTVPPAVEHKPFSIIGTKRTSVPSIEFLSAEEMSQSDRLLAANDDSSIAEHAATIGFDLYQGGWKYEQIRCPAFPNHLFLRYTLKNGDRDVTVFSASIPRNGTGRVRVIPIQKRSYSLFSPAPINELTISAFNHIKAEEGPEQSSSWAGNGLCYAALAGAHPQLTRSEDSSQNRVTPQATTAVLYVPVKGGEAIRFVDIAANPRPMEWTMTFNSHGKLIKTTHTSAPEITARAVPANAVPEATRPVPQAPTK